MFWSKRIPTDFGERVFAAFVPHYQCDMNFILEFHGRVDVERLTNAFLTALALEPMWSHRFVMGFWQPYWQPIPRSERHDLVRVVETDGSVEAFERTLFGPVDVVVRLIIIRGPTDDTLNFRVDHRLADANSARFLINAVAAHYRNGDLPPAVDSPVVRRTIKLLHPVMTIEERKKNLEEMGQYDKKYKDAPVAFQFPPITPDDPVCLPPRLHYPEGALDQLSARAMRDRITPILVVMAATYLAVRDVLGMVPNSSASMLNIVDLRRYLPPEQRQATACMLLGQWRTRIEEVGADNFAGVIAQLRARLAEERGPKFGLRWSQLSAELPHIQRGLNMIPFWLMRKAMHARKSVPHIGVSDLGEFAKPGDAWGDAVLRNCYGTAGTWGLPSISVCYMACGSRFTVTVGSGPRSFAEKLAAAIHRRLCEYAGWPE